MAPIITTVAFIMRLAPTLEIGLRRHGLIMSSYITPDMEFNPVDIVLKVNKRVFYIAAKREDERMSNVAILFRFDSIQ